MKPKSSPLVTPILRDTFLYFSRMPKKALTGLSPMDVMAFKILCFIYASNGVISSLPTPLSLQPWWRRGSPPVEPSPVILGFSPCLWSKGINHDTAAEVTPLLPRWGLRPVTINNSQIRRNCRSTSSNCFPAKKRKENDLLPVSVNRFQAVPENKPLLWSMLMWAFPVLLLRYCNGFFVFVCLLNTYFHYIEQKQGQVSVIVP